MRCVDCGTKLKEYEIYDRHTHGRVGTHYVCPNKWMEDHA